jgi:hypothetical protein
MTQLRLVLSCALVLAGANCAKDDSKPADPSASPSAESSGKAPGTTKGEASAAMAAAAPSEAALTAEVGVEPGGIQREAAEHAGTLVRIEGTVEVRRLGEEAWAPAKKGQKIHEGDLVRATMQSSATIQLADQSLVELGEDTAVAIGERSTAKAPAQSVAVLSGAARFAISARAKGEGAFLVYAPTVRVSAIGDALFTVGVAADGQSRVGAEKTDLTLFGWAKLDAPVTLAAGMAASIDASGAIAPAVKYDPASWGAWRDEVDARVNATAAVSAHGAAMGEIRGDLDASWKDLEGMARQPVGEATFTVASNAQLLTWSLVSHAYLATEIRVRHPEVEAVYLPLEGHIAAAVLYPKKLHVVAYGWLRPAQVSIQAGARAAVAPAAVAWYVRPATLNAKMVVGVAPSIRLKAIFAPRPLMPMAQIRLHGGAAFAIGANAAVEAHGAAEAAHGAAVEAHGAAVKVKAAAGGAKAAAADVKAGVKAGVKVQAPTITPPKVEVKGKAKVDLKAKGGIKIGD